MHKHSLTRRFAPMAVVLIISLLIWSFGLSALISRVYAAQLTNVSDTLSDSDLSVLAKHTIVYTSPNAVDAGETIKIQLDPATSAFSQAFSSATTTDITVANTGGTMTLVSACGGGAGEVTAAGNYNGGADENLTFTVCSGDTVPAGTITIVVGASTLLWTNPGSSGSYVVRIRSGTPVDNADTRVAIIDDVVVTATVNTNLTFTISGVAAGVSVNNESVVTSTTTTATAISFGELASGTPKVAAQQLTVFTNARNGFVVTLQQDQNLLSDTGADIDLFQDGATTSTPIPWTTPNETLDSEATYGHYGITSDDTDLNSGEFGTTSPKYAGNIDAARQVFSHTGPANGITQNKGKARVAIKIEITDLQEAGDYTNTLTYIATPTF